jgi:hypothetical protein
MKKEATDEEINCTKTLWPEQKSLAAQQVYALLHYVTILSGVCRQAETSPDRVCNLGRGTNRNKTH